MSWLNFNESLNSIKGQLTNFATGVLQDGIVNTENSTTLDEDGVSDVQEKFTNVELQESSNVVHPKPPDTWSWDSPRDPIGSSTTNKDEIICNLQKKISVLEHEKREFTVSLEQLDSDCQQTTDKLVTLKDTLQLEYDELKSDFDKFKKEYTIVMNENLAKTKEIQMFKTQNKSDELTKLQEENNILNKQLMISLKEVESKNKLVEKFNELQKQYDHHVEALISERLINEELQKLYNNLEDVNVSLTEKLKKYDKLEPNELFEDYEQITLQTANLAIEQNALIGENEELHAVNDCLKNEILLLKNDYNGCLYQVKELKVELDDTQKVYAQQKQSLELSLQKFKDDCVTLNNDNEKLKNECKLLKSDNNNMNDNIDQLTNDRTNLISNCNILTTFNEKLTNDYQTLKGSYDELESTVTNLKIIPQQSEYQTMHEKYINIISANIQKIIDTDRTDSDSESSSLNEDPLVAEFSQKVDSLLRVLLTFKNKCATLEKEIFDITQHQNSIIVEKNTEIEKLLQNSEILSQEVINKSHSIKDLEDECAELMKNNDLLITELDSYRKINNLQTIPESNEDNVLLLESQLENANRQVEELEATITDLENYKQDDLEVECIKKHLNTTSQELNQTKNDYSKLLSQHTQLEKDKTLLNLALDKTKSDFENAEYKYTELLINFQALKDEHDCFSTECKNLDGENRNLVAQCRTFVDKIAFLEENKNVIQHKLNIELENNNKKDIEMRNLMERLQNSKMSEMSLKLQVDTLQKELQTITDIKQNLEMKWELSKNDFDNHKLEFTNNVTEKFQSNINNLEEQVKELTVSRDDLISLVRTKHEENIKYHDEIQRLNQYLSAEIEKAIVLEKQLSELSVDTNDTSPEEKTLMNEEIEKLKDQNNFLKEKCEILAQNLLQEQSNVQHILQERQSDVDREVASSKELERLREHLVEIEEAYTQELLQAEHKNKEMLMKVNEIEQREKDSSSIYTSVNIRANQQVETLQAQLQLVTSQRDELRIVVSDLEDKENKQVAALTNLQLVLEQFQREKEKDVHQETERIRRQISIEKRIQGDLGNDITALKLQLEESKQGLQAASRLSDQLEKSKQQVINFKDEIFKLQEQLQTTQTENKELSSTSELKVDKTLVKNLVLGYLTSSSTDQGQILKIIATVLDFNQKESEKAKLNRPQQGGWLSTILHPQSLSSNQEVNQQSLSEAFVRFLENESRPKVVPNLLIASQQSKDQASNGDGKTRQSPHTLCEVVLPTFDDFGSSRSSSSILKGVLKNNS